jgi:hypothetical protein
VAGTVRWSPYFMKDSTRAMATATVRILNRVETRITVGPSRRKASYRLAIMAPAVAEGNAPIKMSSAEKGQRSRKMMCTPANNAIGKANLTTNVARTWASWRLRYFRNPPYQPNAITKMTGSSASVMALIESPSFWSSSALLSGPVADLVDLEPTSDPSA